MVKKNLTRDDYEELDDADRRRRHREDRDRRNQRRNKRSVDENKMSPFEHLLLE